MTNKELAISFLMQTEQSDYLFFLKTSRGERMENSKAEVLLKALFPKKVS